MQASNQSTRTKNFLYNTNHFHNLSRQIQQTKINNMTAIVNVLSQKMLTFFTCLLGFSKYSNAEPQGHTNTDEGRQMDKNTQPPCMNVCETRKHSH